MIKNFLHLGFGRHVLVANTDLIYEGVLERMN